MDLSSNIFISDSSCTTKSTHVVSVRRKRKYEEIPQFAMAYSYIYYVLKSTHPYLCVGDNILFSEEYDRKFHTLPYVDIRHTRSFVETKSNRLIEYFKITIWSNKDKKSLIRLHEILETINEKFWKPRLAHDDYMISVDIGKDLRRITVNVNVKTSLFVSKRNLGRRI